MKKFAIALIFTFVLSVAAFAQEQTAVKVLDDQKPISFGLVVDNSGSFRPLLEFVIKTTQSLSRVIEPQDEGFLVRFVSGDKLEILQEMTSNRNELVSAADQMFVEGGHTAIYTALEAAAKNLSDNAKNERRILILISDGDSAADKAIHEDVIKTLKTEHIAVYVIMITAALEQNIRQSQKAMDTLAKETGGAVITVDRKMSTVDAADAVIKAVRAPAVTANSNGK